MRSTWGLSQVSWAGAHGQQHTFGPLCKTWPPRILHARLPEWVASPFSRGSSRGWNLGLLHWTSLVAQTVKRLSTMRETWVPSLGREDRWRRKWQSTPVLLPGKPHGQRSLVGNFSWDLKVSDTTEQLHFHFFSHSKGCLFTLLIVSFVVQKLLSLIRSHLFIFAFISSILGGGSRGSCCDLCRRVFCLCSPLGVL